MEGVRAGPGFSFRERDEFRQGFEEAAARLPEMFRPFWHRWAQDHLLPQFVVYAADGTPVLTLRRLGSGLFRVEGLRGTRKVVYATAARGITEALRTTGLI